MRNVLGLGSVLALTGAAILGHAGDAIACGGCFAPTETEQVVTDHRMVLSIGATQSVLWDQIRYSGAPAEFSWVLPVSGDVTVELGSSAFIDQLDALTAPQIQAPPPEVVNCGCAPEYDNRGAGGAYDAANAADGGGPPPVQVVSEATVGPYETVTLRSTDTMALTDWLTSHGYVIPASMAPVIQSYVEMHMDFFALRLLPGEGVSAMQPVKITYHTATMLLPLRMVGAGVTDKVGLTLFVFGYGRHEAANFGNGEISANDLTWDWTTRTSDYAEVFSTTQRAINSGRSWITQSAEPSSDLQYSFDNYGSSCINYGYGCPDAGAGSDGGANQQILDVRADWNLATNHNAPDMWVTRMRTDLLARYLDSDLILQPRATNDAVSRTIQVTRSSGTGPTVCSYDYSCHTSAGGMGSGSGSTPRCSVPVTVGHTRGGLAAVFAALGLAAFVARRKRY